MLDSPFEERLKHRWDAHDAFRVNAAFHTASAGILRATDRILVRVLGAWTGSPCGRLCHS